MRENKCLDDEKFLGTIPASPKQVKWFEKHFGGAALPEAKDKELPSGTIRAGPKQVEWFEKHFGRAALPEAKEKEYQKPEIICDNYCPDCPYKG